MYDIFNANQSQTEIWRKRLVELRKEKGLSQDQLAQELNKEYGTNYSQITISHLEHVGEQWKKYDEAPFPNMKKLLLVADYFGVDLGYLLGETDYETFEEERASKYLRLNSKTIKTLERITSPKGSFQYAFMTGQKVSEVLEQIIPSQSFGPLIRAFIDLKDACEIDDRLKSEWNALHDKYDKATLDEAFNHVDDVYIEGEPVPPENVCKAINDINQVIDKGYDRQLQRENGSDIARYRLQLAFNDLLNELYPR